MSAAVHHMADHQPRSPQLENGYFRIANELHEAISAADVSKRELKVLNVILRMTYGFRKKEDDIAASQIGQACRMGSSHVTEALISLAKKKIITKRRGRIGCVVGIQKDYSQWPMDDMPIEYTQPKKPRYVKPAPVQAPKLAVVPPSAPAEVVAPAEPVEVVEAVVEVAEPVELEQSPLPKEEVCTPDLGVSGGPESGDSKDSSSFKDILPKKIPLSVPKWEPDAFEKFWTAYPNKTGRKTACKHWDAIKPASALVGIMLDSIAKLKKSRKWRDGFAPQGDTFLSSAGWEDAVADAYTEAESSVLHNYNEMLGSKIGKFVEEEAYSEERARMARVCLQDLEEIVGHPERGEYSARYFAFVLQHCPPKQLAYMTPEWVMRSVAKAVNKDFSR